MPQSGFLLRKVAIVWLTGQENQKVTIEEKLDSLASTAVVHDRQIADLRATTAAHDRQIEALIVATHENTRLCNRLERQWRAYLNRLPRQ